MDIRLSLSPGDVSKEAEETSVTVSGRLDGAKVNNQTLSASAETNRWKDAAGRDADYDIDR